MASAVASSAAVPVAEAEVSEASSHSSSKGDRKLQSDSNQQASINQAAGDVNEFSMQQVANDGFQTAPYGLQYWGATAVAAGPPPLLPQANQQPVNGSGLPPVDSAPLLTPTSPHWNTISNGAGGNGQPVLFQNIGDPAQHSPFGVDTSFLSQSPLFTPANFYSPGPPQFPHAAAFSFPPVDFTNPNAVAAAGYINGRNAQTAGPNLAFFNNFGSNQPTTSQPTSRSSMMNGVKNLSDGLTQLNLASTDAQQINLPSPRFSSGQPLNLIPQLEASSPHFTTDFQNFFPNLEAAAKMNQKDFNDFEASSFHSSAARQQTYANMVRSGDAIEGPKGGFLQNADTSGFGMPVHNNSLDMGAWESNTSMSYTQSRSNMRDSMAKTMNGGGQGQGQLSNRGGNSSEQMRNKPYPSHHNQQPQPPALSASAGGSSHSYSYNSRAAAQNTVMSNRPAPFADSGYSNNFMLSGESSRVGGEGGGTRFNSPPQYNNYAHGQQQFRNNQSVCSRQNPNQSQSGFNNNNNGNNKQYPAPEMVHYKSDRSAQNTEEHKLLIEKLTGTYNFNPNNFDCNPCDAKFFVIKSYSEDDVHRSIKYSVWCSTKAGNDKLDEGFKAIKDKGPMYLFFSVNGSGHFCGLAEMRTPVDYSAQAGVWQQDKWKGRFEVKWIFIKDVPNAKFRHIIIKSNEGKPVTNSRDCQEVPFELGKEMLSILARYRSDTSLLDSYSQFESRQKNQLSRYQNQNQQHNAAANPAMSGGGSDSYHGYNSFISNPRRSYGNSNMGR